MASHSDYPLQRLSEFVIPESEPISLPITSLIIENRPDMMDDVYQAATWHRKWFKFSRELIISDYDPKIPGMTFVDKVFPDSNFREWYSNLCIRELAELCESPFMLVWQRDGFVVNPELWVDQFMDYDYIGAPIVNKWWKEEVGIQRIDNDYTRNTFELGKLPVGNGGFSLRSKRFLESSVALSIDSRPKDPEDFYLCVLRRVELESMGIRFSPEYLASRFSKDLSDKRLISGCFGFHNSSHFGEVKKHLESKFIK